MDINEIIKALYEKMQADLIVQEMSGSIISDNVSDELNLTEISEDTSYDQLWVS